MGGIGTLGGASKRGALPHIRSRQGSCAWIAYRLRALYPVTVTVPSSRAYDYYNPNTAFCLSKPVTIRVN